MVHKSTYLALLFSLSINYLSGKNNELSFELAFTYPDNMITMGIKHHPSDLSLGASYNYPKGQYFFTTESSYRTNPCIKLSADEFIKQMNIIVKPYKKDPKLEAYIKQLHTKTLIKQKNEFDNLKNNINNPLQYLDENDPLNVEIKNTLKKLEAYYGQ